MKRLCMYLTVLAAVACGKDNSNDTFVRPTEKPGEQQTAAEVGKVLPDWTEGCLDIHSINSGRGECTFYILPDGTSMIVDIGEVFDASDNPFVDQRPDEATRPYTVYTRYVSHFLSATGSRSLDYCLVTHYHSDHFGTKKSTCQTHSAGGYILSGVPAFYEMVKFDRIIDRSYPDYVNCKLEDTGSMLSEYAKFVNYNVEKSGLKAESFKVGSTDQFALLRKPSDYPDFKVTNYACGNRYYDNVTVKTTTNTRENPSSAAFVIDYGKFNWFAGGDLVGAAENLVAKAINKEMDAVKADHHYSHNACGSTFMNCYDPRVIVNQSFYSHQPYGPRLQETFSVSGRDVFLTNFHDITMAEYPDEATKVKDYRGHVVIRVSPGGDEYTVFMLDDTDFEYKVRAIYGPYKSR